VVPGGHFGVQALGVAAIIEMGANCWVRLHGELQQQGLFCVEEGLDDDIAISVKSGALFGI
jgi:hypothetical protein